jgi:hypothetical protein
MSDTHKEALALGRRQSQIVREYLDVLEENRPRRGRRRTPESMKKRLDAIDRELEDASSLRRLQLLQERRDLDDELNGAEEPVDVASYERDFVKVAKAYSDSKGISYATWREIGVQPDVLRRAGIPRARG